MVIILVLSGCSLTNLFLWKDGESGDRDTLPVTLDSLIEMGEYSKLIYTDKGIFAKAVLKQFPNTPMEEEGRLTNREIREHFLTAIYTLAKFRKEIAQPSRRKLIEFHSSNKYLFMMYNQTIMRKMGKLLASLSDRKLKETINLYYEMLKKLFSRKPSRRSVINVHMHAMGFFSKDLNTKERSHFLRMLEKLRNQIIPISAVNSILESWLARYEQPYLSKQTFFQIIFIRNSNS